MPFFCNKTRHPCKPRTIDSEGPRKRNLLWPNRAIVSRTACTFACKSDENWNHNQHMDYDWFLWHFQSWQFAHNKNILCSIPKIKNMSRHQFFHQLWIRRSCSKQHHTTASAGSARRMVTNGEDMFYVAVCSTMRKQSGWHTTPQLGWFHSFDGDQHNTCKKIWDNKVDMSAPKTETESFGAPKQRSTPEHYPSITTCPLNKITPK